jgi:toxin ParE1/3/4
MMRFRILPSARLEMLDASDFYESKSEGLGARFLLDIDRSIALMQEAPKRWPQPIRGFHRVRLHDFPYGIFYKVLKTEIVVVAIADLRRRPGYWLRRWRH